MRGCRQPPRAGRPGFRGGVVTDLEDARADPETVPTEYGDQYTLAIDEMQEVK